MIKVLIADHDELFREGLRSVLGSDARFEVVAETESLAQVLESTKTTQPHLVLLDISMPVRSGFEGIAEVKRLRKETRVLVLSPNSEDRYAIRCIRAGADGYLNKSTPAAELIEAILWIHQGRKYIPPTLAERLAVSVGSGSERALHLLSPREFQVLRLVALGNSPTAIASQLNLSTKTVSTYRRRLLDKLDLENNPDLVRFALDQNLI